MSDAALDAFAAEVGDAGPVVAVGGRSQWEVGGLPVPSAREVRPPAGIVAHEPEEMIVRVRAGTTVAELDEALSAKGQMAPLDPSHPELATVGGVLAVGRSGVRRLRWGPVRDLVLEARYVSAEGKVVKTGGPVVKNVTGYDLGKLLVGSLGTVGLIGEVVLRCIPRPAVSVWLSAEADAFAVHDALHRPSAVLTDGVRTWVALEGLAADVVAQRSLLAGFEEVTGPPSLPDGNRRSLRPRELRDLVPDGTWVAEVGVGVVHTSAPTAREGRADAALHEAVRRQMDPTGRLNPGRRPW